MRAPKTKEGGKVQAVPPALLLANKWLPDIDPTGWMMSEKLDGVRAWWNGKDLISRLGNRFDAPKWFTEGLGTQQLDGELWMGRKQFQKAISVVRSQGLDKEWKAVKYLIFDMPEMKQDFGVRYTAMRSLKLPAHCEIVQQLTCKGVEDLKSTLKAYESKGGEGVMLRKPGSLYEGRRSATLLKVKSFYDAEAVIIGTVAGKGRHKGRLGAYECKMPNGKTFSCGSGLLDKDRDRPLKMGTKITYRYVELTDDGIPRFPVYVGETLDK
jgi:DNA ligase-1